MTPEEIRELREKHQPVEIGLANLSTVDYPERHQKIITCRICTMGDGGKIMSYPCDTIKVLDAFAPVDKNTCEHPDFTFWHHWHVGLIRKCVKCGKEW